MDKFTYLFSNMILYLESLKNTRPHCLPRNWILPDEACGEMRGRVPLSGLEEKCLYCLSPLATCSNALTVRNPLMLPLVLLSGGCLFVRQPVTLVYLQSTY